MKRHTVPGKTAGKRSVWKRSVLNKRTLTYCAAILASAVLILAALWLPQAFFEFSDALMYGKVSLMEQEKLDVLTLTTGYEESLYRRLAGFAEGLAGQRQYYVDEQSKEITEEIGMLLFESELRFNAYGIYQDGIIGLFSLAQGFSPNEFDSRMQSGNNTHMELYQWKQYVIYSDDYAQGVNFILWCFGLKNAVGDDMTVLMDARDYTVYAVQMTGGLGRKYSTSQASAAYYDYIVRLPGRLWMVLDIYYDIFEPEIVSEVTNVYEVWSLGKTDNITYTLRDTAQNEVEIYLRSDSDVPHGLDGERWCGKNEDGSRYYSLPLGKNKITFGIYGFEKAYITASKDSVSVMGIREIYELIPEFYNIAAEESIGAQSMDGPS